MGDDRFVLSVSFEDHDRNGKGSRIQIQEGLLKFLPVHSSLLGTDVENDVPTKKINWSVSFPPDPTKSLAQRLQG